MLRIRNKRRYFGKIAGEDTADDDQIVDDFDLPSFTWRSNAKECQSTLGNAKETQQKGVDARYVGGRAGKDTADVDQIVHVSPWHFV